MQRSYLASKFYILVQAAVLLPMLGPAACTDLSNPPVTAFGSAPAKRESPAIVAVELSAAGLHVRFDQTMITTTTVAATGVYKLRDHAGIDNLAAQGDAVEIDVVWLDGLNMQVSWPLAPGVYALRVTSGAQSASGRGLDGLAGKGMAEQVHRPDDDFIDAPADYVSQAFKIGHDIPVYKLPGAYAYLAVSEITAVYRETDTGPLGNQRTPFWTWGQSRVAILPPAVERMGLRLKFYSPPGGRFGLPVPADVSRYVGLFDANGSRLGQVSADLSNRMVVSATLPPAYQVAAAFGNLVTVTSGPDASLTSMRHPDEPLWLFLGQDASPRTVSAAVVGWQLPSKTFVLSDMAATIAGNIYATTVATDRVWYDGELRGGYSLRLSDGTKLRIADATDTVIYLADGTTATDCTDCQVLFERAEERIGAGDDILLTSNVWYLHFGAPPPAAQRQFLVINTDDLLRSLPGLPFRDRERDGDEISATPRPRDDFVVQTSFRNAQQGMPPFTRLNDGLLYPTAFASAELACLGDDNLPICATAVVDEKCAGREIAARAHFSFYTADGRDGQVGAADLIERETLEQAHVQVFAAGGYAPLDTVLNTKAVVHSTSLGTLATTVLSVELLERDPTGCPVDGGEARRGFRENDILRISHLIKSIAVSEPRTLDGNNDGVASASPEDDWLGVWRNDKMTFVPLERFPERP